MNVPLVCVCIPCYNAEKTILDTLASIQAQTYSNIEIHVFDNASTDSTIRLVQSIQDEGILIHTSEETGTAESNFTRCLNLGKGRYTAIYHSDDRYAPTIVEKEVRYLEANNGTSGVLTFATQIDPEGRNLKTYLAPSSLGMKLGDAKSFTAAELCQAVLMHDNFLFCPSAMMRTEVCLNEISTWRGDLFKSSADLDVWLRLAAFNHLALINEPLLFYRISDVQWTAEYRRNRKVRADTFLVLEYWLNKPEIRKSLTDSDFENYQKLLKHDAVGLILNAVQSNDYCFARKIWANELTLNMFWWLLKIRTTKDFKFYILAVILQLTLLPVMGSKFRLLFLRFLGKIRL